MDRRLTLAAALAALLFALAAIGQAAGELPAPPAVARVPAPAPAVATPAPTSTAGPPAELLELLGAEHGPALLGDADSLAAAPRPPAVVPICWTRHYLGMSWRTLDRVDWLVVYKRAAPFTQRQRPVLIAFWNPGVAGDYRALDVNDPQPGEGYFFDTFAAVVRGDVSGWAKTATFGPYLSRPCTYLPLVRR